MLVPIYHRGLLIMGHLPLPSRTCSTPLLPDITITTTPNNMSPPTSPPSPAPNTHTTQEQAQDTCSVQNHIIIIVHSFFSFLLPHPKYDAYSFICTHSICTKCITCKSDPRHTQSLCTYIVCLQFCHF